MLPPQAALYGHDRALPVLPPCVHYAGSERYIARELFPHINNVITPIDIEPAPTAPEIAA